MEEEGKDYTIEEKGSFVTQVLKTTQEQATKTETTGNAGPSAQSEGVQDYTSLSKQQEAPNRQVDWSAAANAIGSVLGAVMGGTQESTEARTERLASYEPSTARTSDTGYTSVMDQIKFDPGPGKPGQAGATGSMSSSVSGENADRPAKTPAPSASPTPDRSAAEPSGNALRDGIMETARALDMDPIDLATAISYETGGTFDPGKKGPTTQWGQHRGLIQFGEPQAKKFGVDFSSSESALASQLGKDKAIVKYLKASGFKPGMSGMDLYSTINAGAPGRYRASDANNGGAPGSVADKWTKQMGPHRKKAMKLLGM